MGTECRALGYRDCMTTGTRIGALAIASALIILGLAGCTSPSTTDAPQNEPGAAAQDVPQAQGAAPLQEIIDAATPMLEAELRRYSDVYSDAVVESEGSNTLVYRYTYRDQVDGEQARSDLSSMRSAFEGFANAILPDMKARGIDDAAIKWVYYNADGTFITSIEFAD